ncbi:MAG TPA: hypothetical protein VHW00_05165 [Thermoanaerobaculia bacterium]|nr:hypothetical protein [Thermoanaerobaculia bacterium]
MKRSTRVLVVLAGYLLAFFVACGVVYVRQLATSDAIAQASSGMYAFGDVVLFAVVFGGLSIPPTMTALYFLRRSRVLWIALVSLAVISAIAAVVAVAAARMQGPLSIVSVLVLLAAPMIAIGLLACCFLAPTRPARYTLLSAAMVDFVASGIFFGSLLWSTIG